MPRARDVDPRILPPAQLGVIGGGAAGLCFADAAHAMGYRVAVLDPDRDSPAMARADERFVAPYDDDAALSSLAARCAAVTVGLECVPSASVQRVEHACATAPRAEAVAVLQDRIREKRFLRAIGLAVAPFVAVISESDLAGSGCYPGILKPAYQDDGGAGHRAVHDARSAIAAWRALEGKPCVLERRLALEREFAVVMARSRGGEACIFPAAETRHVDGLLVLAVVPARIPAEVVARAEDAVRRIAGCLDYVGVLGVEFFVADGGLLVNAVTPRPHDSARYTLDACASSQYEQQVRALCGLPLGDPSPRTAAATTLLAGAAGATPRGEWSRIVGDPAARLHLQDPRPSLATPGRIVGHVTHLADEFGSALAKAEACLQRLDARAWNQAAAPRSMLPA